MTTSHRTATDAVKAAEQASDDAHEQIARAETVIARAEERRAVRRGGRRAMDTPTGGAWSPGQLAFHIGMSHDFVLAEIRAGEIVASPFGRQWRIATAEVVRYLTAKRFPLPDSLAS